MSKKNLPPRKSDYESSTFFINWISLWQASGNDWTWMVKKDSYTQTKTNKSSSSKQRIILIEIALTVALLLLARYIEKHQQPLFNHQDNSSFFNNSVIEVQNTHKNGFEGY